MYSHSVTLESEKCIGCTDCIKRCPTEAIRVKDAKAKIIQERCIDCGNCIAVCRNGAKKAVMDPLSKMQHYKYRVALPAPAFYAQFPKCEDLGVILKGLYTLGFTDYVDVAYAAELIAMHTKNYIKEAKTLPVISSACPVIARLIQRRFPELIDHILPIMSPMELAARLAKENYKQQGIKEEEVGVFFISPCPAKATDTHNPKGLAYSAVDGCFSMQEVYKAIVGEIKKCKGPQFKYMPSPGGMSWAMQNGGATNIGIDNHIAVDGIERVIEVLEKIEDNTLQNVEFVEALACTGGCLGGALTIENAYVSRHTLKKLIEKEKNNPINVHKGKFEIKKDLDKVNIRYHEKIIPKPVFSLDEDVEKAIEMMESIEMLCQKLPQIDCGACGAPTCKCFAEDVVKGESNIEECVFMLRKRIKELSEAMIELTQKFIPTKEG